VGERRVQTERVGADHPNAQVQQVVDAGAVQPGEVGEVTRRAHPLVGAGVQDDDVQRVGIPADPVELLLQPPLTDHPGAHVPHVHHDGRPVEPLQRHLVDVPCGAVGGGAVVRGCVDMGTGVGGQGEGVVAEELPTGQRLDGEVQPEVGLHLRRHVPGTLGRRQHRVGHWIRLPESGVHRGGQIDQSHDGAFPQEIEVTGRQERKNGPAGNDP
jgi:hypothetical protein